MNKFNDIVSCEDNTRPWYLLLPVLNVMFSVDIGQVLVYNMGYQSHLIFQPSMQQCNIATMKKELTHRIYDYSRDNDYFFTICLQEHKFPTVYIIYHQYADSL